MRRSTLAPGLAAALGIGMVFSVASAFSQDTLRSSPRLTGHTPPMADVEAPPLPRWVTDDVRKMRAYPEQPPVIPHSIEGYQLSVNANRSEEHTSELQSLMRISYGVFCLKKKQKKTIQIN